MIDREKVIKALECCEKANNCGNCPYDGECTKRDFALTRDAIALLREQEPVKQEAYENGFHDGYRQAMREANPCADCQEWVCDGCEFARR